ncbi:MAG TPA: hypothetical protein VNH65_12225 [Candidatus Acidoferrum sp.]|nr:hypothetical protein [Candidatus Acidoferrum sp.]
MNTAALPIVALLLCSAAAAQTRTPISSDTKKDIQIEIQNPVKPDGAVPLRNEPHHVLVFQNDYVHAFNVTVPPLDATLLHQHDLPYIYLTLGTTDIVNAVQGQRELHMTLDDGATRYSPGGFAHIARTDAGILFHNITVELAHAQTSPRNLGDKANDRPLGSCPQSGAGPKQDDQIPFELVIPCFETNELRMDLVKVEGGKDFVEGSPETAALLIAMSNANLDVSLGGEHVAFLHGGDVLWLPAGTARKVGDFLGTKSEFLLLSFKDSGALSVK